MNIIENKNEQQQKKKKTFTRHQDTYECLTQN